jgi:hypothetical protein
MPTTAISFAEHLLGHAFLLRAEAVCEAMQYPHWLVTLTAT